MSADREPHFEPLEARASGPGILRRAKVRGLTESDAIAVCRTALREPGIARTLVDEAATELAIHVAILANALDPTLVVLGSFRYAAQVTRDEGSIALERPLTANR